MKNASKLLFIAILCLSFFFSKAQQGDTLEIQRNHKGEITFSRFKPDANRKVKDAVSFLKTVLHVKPDDEFRLTKDTTDKLGIFHRLYQQYYKGIKVENAEYLLHGKNGIIETINGDFQDVNISSVIPSLNEQQALSKALNFVNAKQYKWENANLEKFIQQNTKNPAATYYPKGELVITKDLLKGGNNLRMAWKFTISSFIPDNEQWIYVDATSGEVIRNTPLIYDVNTPCTAQTRYSGTLGITGDSFAGGFRLRENRSGIDIQTLNLQNTNNNANAIDFTNTNTNFTYGSWANFNNDQQALDAHWGAENVLDYWRVVQNRNSIDGNGLRVLGYVHYAVNWSNAQWVSGTNNHYMRYGDGDGIIYKPLTALDICAHEMGHGITEFTAALNPGTEESGALNEGFSDIWGACVEHWAAPNKQTWLMGEEVFATTAFTCVRNLQNPKSTSAWEGQHPDTYHGQFWSNNGEPHTNSTVLSHWFYLLSQGGNGTNDLQNTYSVNGIGINDAQLIAYRTESFYLNSSANYASARNVSIQAARDLYGSGSCQEIAVTNAWYAVGVGAGYVYNYAINGPDNFCKSGNYTVTNLPGGVTVTWSVDNTSVATVSADGVVARVADGTIILTATLSACGTSVSLTKQIIVGSPNSLTGTYSTATSTKPLQTVNFVPVGNIYAQYQWQNVTNISVTLANGTPSGTGFYSYPNMFSFNILSGQSITVNFTGNGTCGQVSATRTFIQSSYYSLVASPNPATGNINVRVKEAVDTTVIAMHSKGFGTSGTNGITKMHLYNFYTGLLVKEWTYQETESDNYNLNIVGVQAGLYVLEMERNNKMCSVKVMVK